MPEVSECVSMTRIAAAATLWVRSGKINPSAIIRSKTRAWCIVHTFFHFSIVSNDPGNCKDVRRMATTMSEDFNGGSGDFTLSGSNVFITQTDTSDALVFRGPTSQLEQATTTLDTSGVPSMDVSFDYYELDTLDNGEGLIIFVDGVAAMRITTINGDHTTPTITVLEPGLISNAEITLTETGNFAGSTNYGSYQQGQDTLSQVSFTLATNSPTTTLGFGARMNQGDEGVAVDNFNAAPPAAVPCFTSRTLILTPTGERRIEDLMVGDLVVTRDNGPQPILWHGQRHVTLAEMLIRPKLRPVSVASGLNDGRRVLVSRQHRMLIKCPEGGGDEQFCHAIDLAKAQSGKARIINRLRSVTYHHLLFDAHQVIFGDAIASESFFPGEWALNALGTAQRSAVRKALGSNQFTLQLARSTCKAQTKQVADRFQSGQAKLVHP
jgi:hypothetical protein